MFWAGLFLGAALVLFGEVAIGWLIAKVKDRYDVR